MATAGGFLLGSGIAVAVGAVGAIGRAFDAGGLELAIVVVAVLVGSAVGACAAPGVRLSRDRLLPLAVVAFAVTAIGSALALGVWDLALWRFGTGLVIGVVARTVSPYDTLGRFRQLGLVAGVLTVLFVGRLLAMVAGGADSTLWLDVPAWRWMFVVLVVPALIAFPLVCVGRSGSARPGGDGA